VETALARAEASRLAAQGPGYRNSFSTSTQLHRRDRRLHELFQAPTEDVRGNSHGGVIKVKWLNAQEAESAGCRR